MTNSTPDPQPSRRELLKALRSEPADARSSLKSVDGDVCRPQPVGGRTIRLSIRAMACEFSAIMNPGPPEQISVAGEALEAVHSIEQWLSIYREQSEISELNRRGSTESFRVRRTFFELLKQCRELHTLTCGGFDVASGSLNQLWHRYRRQGGIPSQSEIDAALQVSGSQHLILEESTDSVRFAVPGLLLDPGAIGKGFALDEAASWLNQSETGPDAYLLHGGHSSLIGRGTHNGLSGWPVGIGNPLFTNRRLGTVLLCDQAMATSGSNIQFFRHEGRRYGHILDPGTGWPVDGMLSVTVFAPSAAAADAISTAFFVLGVEKATICCKNLSNVGVILIPFPEHGRRVQPRLIGFPEDQIFWDHDQVELPS